MKADGLPPILIDRLSGSENLTLDSKQTKWNILQFWSWAYSDVIDNAARGVLAEFIIALALEIDTSKPRLGWADYDLEYRGRGIEVKSASYHQRWFQKNESPITYNIPKTQGWDLQTGQMDKELRRRADVYVLSLLSEKRREQVNPLELSQWKFWVVPTSFLNQRKRSQHSISMASLHREVGEPVTFQQLKAEVDAAIDKMT